MQTKIKRKKARPRNIAIAYRVPAYAPELGRISVNGQAFHPAEHYGCEMVLYWLACGKHKEATDAIKRAIRKQRKRPTMFTTYGYDKQGGGGYVYIHGLKAGLYDLPGKLAAFKEVKRSFAANNEHTQGHTAELGAGYQVQSVARHSYTLDLAKPVVITLHGKTV